MKITNKIILLLTFGLFITTSCTKEVLIEKEEESTCYDYIGRPAQALTYNEVAKMELHYDTTKRESIKESRGGKEDTWLYHYNLDNFST